MWKMSILKTRGTERDWVVCPGRSLQAEAVEHKNPVLFPAPMALFYVEIARPGCKHISSSPSALP